MTHWEFAVKQVAAVLARKPYSTQQQEARTLCKDYQRLAGIDAAKLFDAATSENETKP